MRAWQALAAVVLFWAAVYLPGLGGPELKGEEGRRVLPGRNMLETGEWVVPEVGGTPYHRKPPLVNWLAAGSFTVFDRQNEWTARAPSALFVLLLALTVTGFTARWLGPDGGLIAGLASILNPALIEKGRLAEIEAVYVPLTGMALAVWTAHHLASGSTSSAFGRWAKYLVPAIPLGLGFLAKGPVHLLFYYAPVLCVLGFSRRLRELVSPPHVCALILTITPFLAWAALAKRRTAAGPAAGTGGGEAPDEVWLRQLTSRLDLDGFRLGNWLKTPLEGAVNFAPWIVPLVVLWWWFARRRRWEVRDNRESEWARGMAWGTAVAFLLVALIPQSEARYAHPALGGASLLFGWMVVELGRLPEAWSMRDAVARWWNRINGVLVAVVALGALAVPVVVRVTRPEAFALLPAVVGLAGAIGLVFGARMLARQSCLTSRTVVTSMVIAGAVWVYVLHGIPVMNREDNVRSVGRAVDAAVPEGARLCVLDPGIQPFLFYLKPGYREVDRASRIPPDTTHLLATPAALDKVRHVKHFQSFEFVETARFRDKDDRDHVLLRSNVAAHDIDGGPAPNTVPGESP